MNQRLQSGLAVILSNGTRLSCSNRHLCQSTREKEKRVSAYNRSSRPLDASLRESAETLIHLEGTSRELV
jgi:hypothetical protein